MRRLYRVHHDGEWTDAMAQRPEEALDLVKNCWIAVLDSEDFEYTFKDAEVQLLGYKERITYLCDSGERVSLSVEDWLEMLPTEFSYVWGSSTW